MGSAVKKYTDEEKRIIEEQKILISKNIEEIAKLEVFKEDLLFRKKLIGRNKVKPFYYNNKLHTLNDKSYIEGIENLIKEFNYFILDLNNNIREIEGKYPIYDNLDDIVIIPTTEESQGIAKREIGVIGDEEKIQFTLIESFEEE